MEPLATAMRWVRTRSTLNADAFVRRYRDPVFRLALSILGRPDAAEDVAQDVLLRALKQESISAPMAWLRVATVRRAVTALEERPMQPLPECAWPAGDAAERIAVQQTLAQLSADQQALLALAVGERWSYREIAEALDIPEGTVASRLNAAKESFRRKWGTQP